ncbi:MAG: 4Fe-4S dicluster domain-containing protein [Fibrobacteria bacterium]|nr:4Fe-4S dicluster domain-containing protein [Fibrobacteria bacterium]
MKKKKHTSGEMKRRDVLKSIGALVAASYVLPGCRRTPDRSIVSRPFEPEYQEPGKALYYASTWTEGPYPYGVLVKTLDGRPIKVDGNPDHPVNEGRSNAAMQASVLGLYDPDRLKHPLHNNVKSTWDDVDQKVIQSLSSAKRATIVTRSTLGPSERALIKKYTDTFRGLRHLVYDPAGEDTRVKVWSDVYNASGSCVPCFDKASVILSLDSDFLAGDGVELETSYAWSKARAQGLQNGKPPVFYMAESGVSLTGSCADERISLAPSKMGDFSRALLNALSGNSSSLVSLANTLGLDQHWIGALVNDLKQNRGKSLVVAGAHLPKDVQATVALLNHELQAEGRTLLWEDTPELLRPVSAATFKKEIESGLDLLILLGVDPAYYWPLGDFAASVKQIPLVVGHGLYLNQSLSYCNIALPSHHYLESWNDASPRSGLVSICQPAITHLYNTRQEADSLLRWFNGAKQGASFIADSWYDFVKNSWQRGFTRPKVMPLSWEAFVRKGVADTSKESFSPVLDKLKALKLLTERNETSSGAELVIHPHHGVGDGRFSNNAWLQELPHPVSKIVWDSVALMSPTTAKKFGLVEGSMAKITASKAVYYLPVAFQEGMAEDVITATMGHGKSAGGTIEKDLGSRCVPHIPGKGFITSRFAVGVQVTKTAGSVVIARSQNEFSAHDRPIVLEASFTDYARDKNVIDAQRHKVHGHHMHEPTSFTDKYKWGMAIDLNRCTGCGACTLSCQVENNIPVVGKSEVRNGREMHWMRLDSYYKKSPDGRFLVSHQPMLCQHCDNAPCETVCPVAATVHNEQGLNEMVYNRCVGTRYCANNCPYKVRRFNYFNYQKRTVKSANQELMFNPQVTVRTVGTMEKCTFCIQRINAAKMAANNAGKIITDEQVLPACAGACPSGAIVFGNLHDPSSAITKLRKSSRAFYVNEEINTAPNVTYLARIRNTSSPLGGTSHG